MEPASMTAYPAVYQCHGHNGELDMIIFHDGQLLERFTFKFVPEVDSGPIFAFTKLWSVDVNFWFEEDDEDIPTVGL